MNRPSGYFVGPLMAWVAPAATATRAASITFVLVNPGPDFVAPHSTVTIEVRATYDTPLVAATFAVSASGEPAAVLTARSADPVTPAGLTYISTTSQTPFEPGLPHDLKASAAIEVLLDLDFDQDPGGPFDGMAPGSDVLIETLDVEVSGTGILTLAIGQVSAAHTESAPGGQLFDSAMVDPQAAEVTIELAKPGDIDLNGHVTLRDFATFALCYGSCEPDDPPPGCSTTEFSYSDLNGDGCVSLGDFAIFALYYGL